jgi:hypothetical protein
LVVTCERTPVEGIDHLQRMSFDINVALGSFEIDRNQLTVLIEHKVLRFNVSVEVPAIVYKLKDLQNVNKYCFWR